MGIGIWACYTTRLLDFVYSDKTKSPSKWRHWSCLLYSYFVLHTLNTYTENRKKKKLFFILYTHCTDYRLLFFGFVCLFLHYSSILFDILSLCSTINVQMVSYNPQRPARENYHWHNFKWSQIYFISFSIHVRRTIF